MGSKGSQTVNQNQTYTPNPVAGAAITGALGQAQNVAQTPFQTPVAPVAGFTGDQGYGFQAMRGAVGAAQPYLNTAANYFSPAGISQFFNPMSDSVMAGMKDVFGQQMKQTTGNLTQQAGGVGADRIAVGQSELARQQGLAAGQTEANLYSQAASQAQGAGFGMGSIGPAIQQMMQSGAQGVLGTGGLQQQLAQAQMNAPYQNILQQIAWPYQNSQFLTQATAALAPGLGGTTNGGTTYPGASPWGTIAGAGMAGLGAYGGAGGFSGGSGKGGGGYGLEPPAGGADFDPSLIGNRGGRVPEYASGGGTDDNPDDLGGTVSTHPYDGASDSLIPMGQITPIQPHIPQLQQQQQSNGKGSGLGQILGTAAKIGMMMANQGGRVNGYASGGAADMGPLSSLIDRIRGMPSMMGGNQDNQNSQGGQGNPYGGLMSMLGKPQGLISMLGQGKPMGLASGLKGGGQGMGQGMADGGAPDDSLGLPTSMADVSRGVPNYGDVLGQDYPSPGLMRPESPDIAGRSLRALPRTLAPNITSLAMGEPDPKAPPQIEGAAPGKTESFEDPRYMGAVPEAAGLAAMATPAGAARGLARGLAPALAEEAAGAGSNVGRGMTTGMAASTGAAGLSGEADAVEAPKDPADQLISVIDGKITDANARRAAANAKKWDKDETKDAQKRKQAVDGIDQELKDLREERRTLNAGKLTRVTTATQKQADLDRPFRDNYPLLANAFMGMGLGISAALPLGTKLVRAGMNNRFVKDWAETATKAERALEAGDRAGAQLYVKQLEGFEQKWAKVPEPKAGFKAWGTGILAPTEAAMLPEHIDLMTGTPKAKEKAMETMLDPLRVPGAAAAGLTFSSIASKWPLRQRLGASEAARGYGATKLDEEMRAADNLARLRREEINAKARETRARNKDAAAITQAEAPKSKRTRKKAPEEAFGGAVGNPYARGGFATGGFDDRFDDAYSPSFDQRWAPVDDAVDAGIGGGGFDPGTHDSYFSDQSKQQRAAANDIPIPRPRPDEAPSGEVPNVPSPPTQPEAPSPGGGGDGNPFSNFMGNFAGGKRGSFMDSPWGALMAAGLGTMAASGQRDARGLPLSPWAAIGQGGMQGMGMLQKQRENAMKQQTIDQQAGRLRQQMELQRTQMMAPVKIGQDRYGRDIYGIRDPQSGKIVPINPVTGQPGEAPVGGSPLEGGAPGIDRDVPDPKDLIIPPTARPAAFQAPNTNSQALEGLPPEDALRVKAIAEGRRKAMSENSRNAPYARYIMSKVHEYDPQYDETTFARRQRTANFFAVGTQGGGGQNIAAMNTWAQHLDHYLNLTQELNLGQYTDWNQVVVALGKRGYTGEQIQGKLKELDIASKAVADEGAKVFAGTNSALADRQEWEHKFSLETPAKAALDAARTAQKLVEGRLTSLTHMYNEGMRTNHQPLDLVAPETQAVFDKVRKSKEHYGAGGGGGGGGEGVPEGTMKQFKQGWGVYRNGKWQPYQNQGPMP